MHESTTTRPIWTPTEAQVRDAAITRFADRVGVGDDYWALHRWSVTETEAFWSEVADFVGVRWHRRPDAALGKPEMPGAEWFPGAELNYAEHYFADRHDDRLAIQFAGEGVPLQRWSWGRLRQETERMATALAGLGVERGSRVAAIMPNIPEAVAAFLACASIGAVWSLVSPEFGVRSIVDRFAQIDPTVLIAVDGYRYGGRDFDRWDVVEQTAAALPGLRAIVRLGHLDGTGWDSQVPATGAALEFVPLPFSAPLWIVYSSGTTGLPKAFVHGQGNTLLPQLKDLHLHGDPGADSRFFWHVSTGWIVWYLVVSQLLGQGSIVLWDGSPLKPDEKVLWDLAADAGVTSFGASPGFFERMAADAVPVGDDRDLSRIRTIWCTGAPLPGPMYRWLTDHVGSSPMIINISGGTDVVVAFVGGVPTLPVYAGEIQAPLLGNAVEAWDPEGHPLVGTVGELVVTRPMPSMPLALWGDDDGSRLRETYFETYPGVWRHGDWIEFTDHGGVLMRGRSDATINRGGVRSGTAEIYQAVLSIDGITDALIVDLSDEQRDWLPLFVTLAPGAALNDDTRAAVLQAIREQVSPRHCPTEIIAVPDVPRTINGKLMEVPVKRLLAGEPLERVASRDSTANPEAFDAFVALAAARSGEGQR